MDEKTDGRTRAGVPVAHGFVDRQHRFLAVERFTNDRGKKARCRLVRPSRPHHDARQPDADSIEEAPSGEIGKQQFDGRLLRTVFLCDYFLNDTFRRELLRVLNRGEAVNALKRAIYTGRVASHQAKRPDEMQAVSDALSLLANIVMAWNTTQMQQALDHWAQRRGGAVPPELIGRVAPTRTEGINLRGMFRFPVERYADKILPSAAAEKTTAGTL